MFRIIVGIICGTAVVAGAVAVAKHNKKYATVTTEETEDKSVLKSIKEGTKKKVLEILMWVIDHKEQVEAASTLIGIVAGAIEIGSYIKGTKQNNEILGRLERIENNAYDQGWKESWDESFRLALKASKTGDPMKYRAPEFNINRAFKIEEVATA
ncbi:hypothetical protein [Lachnoclostridium sp. Marseille-P6806]|uniref:hypothetical protein n=1 Tax=Lachnoclostridium sp. Marseille-P6806 TaxID=2364793 RepID=UPI00103012F8|nr:hypothetical protein [Lachnoclostridium sp. Marseille-P6806]